MPLGNLKTTLHRTRVFKPNTRLPSLTWKGLDPDLPLFQRTSTDLPCRHHTTNSLEFEEGSGNGMKLTKTRRNT